ncbi:MAG: YihY/virulence factor BrkB family protein [Burkholderiaceae bacterium]|nr:YihY/virulence factor BrkB family protein [Burkholderiaceae bacterium]
MSPPFRTTLAEVGSLIGQVWRSWNDDYASSMGAALAYYTMFSLAPLLLIVISVAGLVFGEAAARGEIQAQLEALMGEQSASAIQSMLASVHDPSKGIAGTLLGVLLLLIGATTVFGELQDALDRIWRVPAKGPGIGWITLLRSRMLSFGMILSLGFLLTVSLVISATLAAAVEFGRRLNPVFGNWSDVVEVGNAMGGFVLAAMAFALIFKVMPRVQVQWKDVWIGAVFTAGLFSLGKSLIGLYIGRSGIASGFGAAGSLVVVLLWVYWSAQILLIGAEFTWVYANRFGSRRGEGVPIRKGQQEARVDYSSGR